MHARQGHGQQGETALAGINDQMKMSREHALLGNYDASLVYFDGVISQIQRYLKSVDDPYVRSKWEVARARAQLARHDANPALPARQKAKEDLGAEFKIVKAIAYELSRFKEPPGSGFAGALPQSARAFRYARADPGRSLPRVRSGRAVVAAAAGRVGRDAGRPAAWSDGRGRADRLLCRGATRAPSAAGPRRRPGCVAGAAATARRRPPIHAAAPACRAGREGAGTEARAAAQPRGAGEPPRGVPPVHPPAAHARAHAR